MTCLDHSTIDLEELDPTPDWFQSEEAPFFHLEDLANLEGQATQDMGETAS